MVIELISYLTDSFLVTISQAFQKWKLRIQTESARIIIINYLLDESNSLPYSGYTKYAITH